MINSFQLTINVNPMRTRKPFPLESILETGDILFVYTFHPNSDHRQYITFE